MTRGETGPSRLRVLLATHSSDRGSTSRTLEGWVRRLPDHGIAPTVTIGGAGPLYDALSGAGVHVEVLPIRVFPSKSWPFPFLAAVLRYVRLIRRVRPHLVHVNEHEHYPVVAYAARLTKTPIVVHVRFRPLREHCAWLFKRPYDPARVFFTSETQQSEVGPNLEGIVARDKWRLLRNAVDLSAFEPDQTARTRLRESWALDAGTVALGTASSISPRKRLDHVIRVVHDLRREGCDVRGFIAGMPYFAEDHAELDRLRRLIDELGVAESVTLLGYVEPVKPLYDAWDVCFSTSEYESFGMTVLESMACGCPVVAYPGGAVEEVLATAGMIVRDGDLGALTDATRRLVQSADLRAEIGALARQRAASFDIEASTAELAREYRAVVGARAS